MSDNLEIQIYVKLNDTDTVAKMEKIMSDLKKIEILAQCEDCSRRRVVSIMPTYDNVKKIVGTIYKITTIDDTEYSFSVYNRDSMLTKGSFINLFSILEEKVNTYKVNQIRKQNEA